MKKLILLGVAMAACSAMADTFTITKWLQLVSYDGSYQNVTTTNFPDTPPAGWNIGVTNNTGTLNTSGSTQRKKNQPGTVQSYLFGSATFEVKVQTTKTPQSTCKLNVLYTNSASANATASWSTATSTAYGIVSRPDVATKAIMACLPNGEDSQTVGPKSGKYGVKFENVSWTTTNGISEAYLTVPSADVLVKSVSTCPNGSSSNLMATTGNGSTDAKLQIGGLNMPASGSHQGEVSGTINMYGKYGSVEIRNEFNAYVDDWCFGPNPGEFFFLMQDYPDGNYRLYFRSRGSLRKRVDITWVNATGLSGLNVTVLYGDLDGNNQVDASEVADIATFTGRVSTNDNFYDLIPGKNYMVSDCDMNKDGQISAVDYLMALANLGVVGD